MIIIPSIDISGGYAVKRVRGVRGTELIRLSVDEAIKLTRRFNFVHIVDLDGAEQGRLVNIDSIARISREFNSKCEVGGGIRTPEVGKEALKLCSKVVIGTAALEGPGAINEFIKSLGYESVVVSIDVLGNFVMSRGWTKPVGELQAVINSLPRVHTLIYTAIDVEGTGAGPLISREVIELLRSKADEVFYAGGISTCGHIEQLRDLGLDGVIIGYALYVKGVDCAGSWG
ncbi:HisA/HisF-related TIM barrel protein [Vulcanisaeta distributa]|uniref:Histidine biosynthesis protein n=1 Tax=Vulcanisaeta distributa (strain DSM 14429 / JCM 11212 / NBRC 100878 / IC-017) TaxID=572478 RepID=E1QV71_VULDI|nr:HisA/HisF-related TIM barrel protein [Vulcanisaeta distributa]ADN49998.1 histidine biosynthesis protein [Vulcanisaeta distributa DSM 14429]